MVHGFWAVVLAVSVLMSGCVSSSSESFGPGGIGTDGGPAFNETTGSIRGAVRTDEIQPIVGAQVGIVGTTIVAMTDEVGRYALNFVPPGRVNLAVIALGYLSDSRSVDVVAGEVTDQDFIMTLLPSTAPYHTTHIFTEVVGGVLVKVGMQCMYGSQYGIYVPPGYPVSNSNVKTCQGGGTSDEKHYGHCGSSGDEFETLGCDLNNEWQTITSELQWTPTSAASGRGWSWETMAPNSTRSTTGNMDSGSADQKDLHNWWKMGSKAPIQTRIDRATALEGSPSGTPGNHPMVEEDLCGFAPGSKGTPGHCDWVTRLFAGWCTIGGLTGGAAGCENQGPDFIVDPVGSPVTIYFTYFIREEAPPGFTAIPDT